MAFVTARRADGMKRMCARRMLGAILLIGLTSLVSSAAFSQVALHCRGQWEEPKLVDDAHGIATLSYDGNCLTLAVDSPYVAKTKARCVLASKPFPFKSNTRYRLSCAMRTDSPGVVQLGVGYWPNGFDKFFQTFIPFPVTSDWETYSFEFRTPPTDVIPALAVGKTCGYVKLPYGVDAASDGKGATSVQFRNWNLEELSQPQAAEEMLPPSGNCVPNASFELGVEPHGIQSFTDYGADAKAPVWSLDETTAKHGHRSIRIDNTQTGFRTKFASCELHPGPGREWFVGIWAKADRNVEVILNLMDAVYNRDFQSEDWLSGRKSFKVGTEWTYLTISRPRGAWRCLSVHVRIDEPGILWLDALQVASGFSGQKYDFRPAAESESVWALPKHLYFLGEKAEATRRSLTYADSTTYREECVHVPTDRYGVFTVGEGLGVRYAVVGDVPAGDPEFYTGFNGFECMVVQGDGRLTWRDDGTHSIDEHFRQLRLAGANMVRLHDSGTWWYTVEREKGVYNWSTLDLSVEKCIDNGIAPMIVFGHGGIVAEREPGSPSENRLKDWFVRRNGTYYPSGLSKRRCVKIAAEDWDRWVTAVVTRYRGKVRHYEVYNEPNLTCPSAEEYVECLRRSYVLIRRLDPGAVVVGICATGDYGADTGAFVEKVGELGGFDCLDWVSFHPYNAMMDFTVRKAEDQLHAIRGIVDRYRPGVPLLNDELYYMADRRFVTHDTGLLRDWPAGNLIRRYVMDKAAGLRGSLSITANQLYEGDAGHPFTLQPSHLANGWQPGERFVVANAFARFLNGATFIAKPPVPKGINAFCFRTSSGGAIIVAWRIKPDGRGDVGSVVARVPLTIPDRAVAYDMFGNRLPEGALLVGEDPVYIMQKSVEEKPDEDY